MPNNTLTPIWRNLPMFFCAMLAVSVMKPIEKALTPGLGAWSAWGIGILAGAVLVMVASTILDRVYRELDKKNQPKKNQP
jgi:hypothetical protein